MSTLPGCFKAYDVRGRVPQELDPELARRIGRVLVDFLGARRIAVGWDVRHSSPALVEALCEGICSAGADACTIGLCGTEEMYFTVFDRGLEGVVMVTASHNPPEYNGMKIVREDARPLSADTGLWELGTRVANGACARPARGPRGRVRRLRPRAAYVRKLLSFVETERLRPFRIVSNPGNGGAGEIIDRLEPCLPFEFIRLQHRPDGDFPHGVPNPMLEQNRSRTARAVRRHRADFGLAWDGDFDRCFFFDESGGFIESYYLIGLLAKSFLHRSPGAAVVYEPRLVWNTLEAVAGSGGRAVQSKAGHAFIKEIMRREDAVYGGEMSAHHYFRDFRYCDSGMIPWLLVAELMSDAGVPLSRLLDCRRFPCSGEINRPVQNAARVMERVKAHYRASAQSVEHVDGLSLAFADWRFNLRPSNTEPLLRLNVESRADEVLLAQKTAELLELIDGS